MLAILNSLNVHSFPIFQPILMILVSQFMIHRALSDKTYLSLGLLSLLKSSWIVLPAKSDSDDMFCLQSYYGLRIDRSLIY